jgi:hypothetical protein
MDDFFSPGVALKDVPAEEISLLPLLTLFSFNKLFKVIIRLHKISTTRIKPLDLVFATIISECVIKDILPLVKEGIDYLPKDSEGAIMFEPRLYKSEPTQILHYANSPETKDPDNVKMMVFELCYSYLEVFNKCSQRFYPSYMWEAVRVIIPDDQAAFLSFDYLFDFSWGILFRTEILRIYLNYHIFWTNHILDKRLKHNRNTAFSNLELAIPKTH